MNTAFHSIACICCDDLDRRAGCFHGRIDAINDDLAFIRLSGRHFDVEDHAAYVVDNRMLLVGGFQTPVSSACRHRCVGVGDANLLALARLSGPLLSVVWVRLVRICDGFNMSNCRTHPAHVRADQRRIDMDNLAGCDLCRDASRHCLLEDPPEALDTPPVTDPRQ